MVRRLITLAMILAGLLLVAAPAQALELGFNDEDLLLPSSPYGTGVDDAGMAVGLANARGAGATTWRLELYWSQISPVRPPTSAVATDPSWDGYQWSAMDRQVRAVTTAGLNPLLWASRAPAWAEGANRPAVSPLVPAGTWRPNANAFGEFATALAKRYSGSFPDPLSPGATLPRVSDFQGWNEPNIYPELTPQYVENGSAFTNASASMFRSLQNAFYRGVKRASPAATVVAGATAPFGDYPDGGNRTPPASFWRKVLCESGSGAMIAVDRSCPKIYFDAFAHNPYSPYLPTRKAANVDDVTVPDLRKLVLLVKQGVAAGVIKPGGSKPLWITELSWDSTPDPSGLSPADQASNIQGAISILAKAGARHILFWNSRDDAPVPAYNQSFQSGIFYRGATPAQDIKKPSWTAYRFPFTAYRDHGGASLWGKAPAPGPVVIQRLSGSKWRRYTTLKAGSDGVFSERVDVPSGARFRATQDNLTSLIATH